MKHRPATLVRRFARIAALHQGAPVGVEQFGVQAELLEVVKGDMPKRRDRGHVGRVKHHDFFAVIARCLQRGARRGKIALDDILAQLLAIARAAGEQRLACGEQAFVIAGHRAHVVLLRQTHGDGPAHRQVVERRMQVIEPHRAVVADRVGVLDTQVAHAADQWHQVGLNLFPPVDLLVLQRGGNGGGVGDDLPLHPLDVGDLAAGQPFRRLPARHVAVEALIGDVAALDEFVGEEAVRTRADHLADLLVRIGLGQMLGHDERHHAVRLAQRISQQGKGALELHLDGAVIGSRPFLDEGRRGLAKHVAGRPALQALGAIARQHGLAVVKLEAGPQLNQPGPAVILDAVALGHLRLGFELGVHAEQRVEDIVTVGLHRLSGGPVRIERGQVGGGHEFQHARLLGDGGRRERGQSGAGGNRTHEIATLHRHRSPPCTAACRPYG